MEEFYSESMTADERERVQFLIVNGVNPTSVAQISQLVNRAPSMPVIQDVANAGDYDGQLWLGLMALDGQTQGKDDIIVLDREGNLITYFDMQDSNLSPPAPVLALVNTIKAEDYEPPCGAQGCQEIYAPVCADGVTYDNECFADEAGVTDFTVGECSEGPTCNPEQGKIVGQKSSTSRARSSCDCHERCVTEGAAGWHFKLPTRGKRKGKCFCFSSIRRTKNSRKFENQQF